VSKTAAAILVAPFFFEVWILSHISCAFSHGLIS
jgi:hypothetical protein